MRKRKESGFITLNLFAQQHPPFEGLPQLAVSSLGPLYFHLPVQQTEQPIMFETHIVALMDIQKWVNVHVSLSGRMDVGFKFFLDS